MRACQVESYGCLIIHLRRNGPNILAYDMIRAQLPDDPGVDSAQLPAHEERSDGFAGSCAGHSDVRPTFHRRGKEGCLG